MMQKDASHQIAHKTGSKISYKDSIHEEHPTNTNVNLCGYDLTELDCFSHWLFSTTVAPPSEKRVANFLLNLSKTKELFIRHDCCLAKQQHIMYCLVSLVIIQSLQTTSCASNMQNASVVRRKPINAYLRILLVS